MSEYSKQKGYALAILMVVLVVVSVALAVSLPQFSKKKDSLTNTSSYVKSCIVDNSGDKTKAPCVTTLTNLNNGNTKDYDSLLYYLKCGDTGETCTSATYHSNALLMAKAACDAGVSSMCRVIADRCGTGLTNGCSEMFTYAGSGATGATNVENLAETYFNLGMSTVDTALQSNCPANNKLCNVFINCPSNTSNPTCSSIMSDCITNITTKTSCNLYTTTATKTYDINSANISAYSAAAGTNPAKLVYTATSRNITSANCGKNAYFTTLDSSQISDILGGVGGIKSFSVTSSIGSTNPGTIYGLVSFDGRNNWCKCSGGTNCSSPTWDCTKTVTDVSTGNTPTQLANGLTNYVLPSGKTHLDFAFYLKTKATTCDTVSISQVTVNYLKAKTPN